MYETGWAGDLDVVFLSRVYVSVTVRSFTTESPARMKHPPDHFFAKGNIKAKLNFVAAGRCLLLALMFHVLQAPKG